MIRRPPRSTQSRSSAASDVYKRQDLLSGFFGVKEPEPPVPATVYIKHPLHRPHLPNPDPPLAGTLLRDEPPPAYCPNASILSNGGMSHVLCVDTCLLYTSPSPRDQA
eukprot:TRINITY_DN29150_c0_g1_i1.p1 TRINITY_DN29150_c0_g1~~TRINITY_DN29150_c0_g1_i1.p1  ORF type:complete len:108 (+),score=20.23 TRINITY_DN29150_c0_g1_i1:1-324(+)